MTQHDYGADYYDQYRSHPYRRGVEAWHRFFDHVAQRIVDEIGPATVLDAGCAIGFLVEALRARGVDAEGVDISQYAISQVPPELAPYCRVASISEPLERRYDLIVCMEVLEHISDADARKAISSFAMHADAVLFSSTPDDDLIENTHVNVQVIEHWSRLFAEQGLFRDWDFDPESIARHAGLFRRTSGHVVELVEGYERERWRLLQELRSLRSEQALAELRRPLRRASRLVRRLIG